MLNLFSQTQREKLENSKESFREVMPFLRGLTPAEQEAFIHKVRNSGRHLGDSVTEDLLSEMTYQEIEQKLAKLSEEENFN